jgi:23S rRNA pseudouridine955/2504/2580 synthase
VLCFQIQALSGEQVWQTSVDWQAVLVGAGLLRVTVQYFEVSDDEAGQRLDNYLMSRLKGAPKSLLYRVIRKGEVRVNKGRVKPDSRLSAGDRIRVPPMRLGPSKVPQAPSEAFAAHLASAIVYDKDGLLIVNKPSGLAVHGGSGISLGLIESLRQLPGNKGFMELVHRLDRDTSGLVMVARKRSMLKYLQEGLRQRDLIQKHYLALTAGCWPQGLTQVDAPLLKSEEINSERFVRVHPAGKPSLTRFQVQQAFACATLVEAKPVTGRTHQIRVHAKHAGHPLIGDEKYGDAHMNQQLKLLGARRLFLHAWRLQLQLPSGEALDICAPLPDDLQKVLAALAGAANKGGSGVSDF